MTLGQVCQMAVIICWLGLAAAMFIRKKGPPTQERKRSQAFVVGVILQAIGFALLWTMRRDPDEPLLPLPGWFNDSLMIGAPVVAAGAVLFIAMAIRTLGAHWTLAARTIEGHKLVDEGPFAIVRHPIYSGLFALLIATGIVSTSLPALAAAIIAYAVGMWLRLRVEERLLVATFGNEYSAYCARVPAVFPRIRLTN